ncbi:MAG TPA: HAD family phosphatase [Nocardioidaceae bacterium]|nr:HAD family phosphatase [Nocardioidaceae bacterium]
MSTAGRRLQAVLWDMDGTLVDTEPVWIAAEYELAAKAGATWSEEHGIDLIGRDLLDSGQYIRDHMGLDLTAEQVVEELLDRVVDVVSGGLTWCPGARELLTEQAEAGVPAALVTMSYRRLAQAVVDALPAGTFGAVVVGDEVTRGKPHPEPYLSAARLLDADPARCVAIEDSRPGVQSAQAAGCHVLAVPNHQGIPDAPKRTVHESLGSVRLADLERMLDGSVAAGSPACTGGSPASGRSTCSD